MRHKIALQFFIFAATIVVVLSRSNSTSPALTVDCRYYPINGDSCISNYEDLETFIRADDEQIAALARNFYRTGEDPTQYIKITYLFQIPSGDASGDNDSCVAIHRSYIWSTSPVFLLGPRALFWLSLFSISVNEESVTIRLPCLQATAQRDLLTRLTYLVGVTCSYFMLFVGMIFVKRLKCPQA